MCVERKSQVSPAFAQAESSDKFFTVVKKADEDVGSLDDDNDDDDRMDVGGFGRSGGSGRGDQVRIEGNRESSFFLFLLGSLVLLAGVLWPFFLYFRPFFNIYTRSISDDNRFGVRDDKGSYLVPDLGHHGMLRWVGNGSCPECWGVYVRLIPVYLFPPPVV